MTSKQRPAPCIVVGYDGSESSRAAVRFAAARAGSAGKVVVVLSLSASADPWPIAGPANLLENPVEHGEAMLDALMMEEAEALADTDCETHVAHGDPARAIVDMAAARDADEIAIGTRGAGRVGSLLGSVAQSVLHHADRPVVVIPKRAVAEHHDAPAVSSVAGGREGQPRP